MGDGAPMGNERTESCSEPRQRRVTPRVTDVGSSDPLLSYAIAGQLALVKQHLPGISESRVAYGAGLGSDRRTAGPALTAAVRDGPTPRQLAGLDEVVGALIPQVERTGGLCSLDVRLSLDPRDKIAAVFGANAPPSWTKNLRSTPPAGDVGVLAQASALLSAFLAADKAVPGG